MSLKTNISCLKDVGLNGPWFSPSSHVNGWSTIFILESF